MRAAHRKANRDSLLLKTLTMCRGSAERAAGSARYRRRRHTEENAMRNLVISLAAVAAAAFVPAATMAQGIAVDTPVGGVRIGDPGYHRYYRDYDGPVVRERRIYRERDVGLRSDCRTITIQRDDGSMKRIRRCD